MSRETEFLATPLSDDTHEHPIIPCVCPLLFSAEANIWSLHSIPLVWHFSLYRIPMVDDMKRMKFVRMLLSLVSRGDTPQLHTISFPPHSLYLLQSLSLLSECDVVTFFHESTIRPTFKTTPLWREKTLLTFMLLRQDGEVKYSKEVKKWRSEKIHLWSSPIFSSMTMRSRSRTLQDVNKKSTIKSRQRRVLFPQCLFLSPEAVMLVQLSLQVGQVPLVQGVI